MMNWHSFIWKKVHAIPQFNLRAYWMILRIISWPFNLAYWYSNSAALDKRNKVVISLSSFNSEAWIEQTIRSIQHQKMQSWRLIIHDDGSSDSSPEIIKSLAEEDTRIQYTLNDTSKGPYANHNSARKIALIDDATTHFTVIDHDDIAHSNWLARSVCIQEKSFALGVRPINIRVTEDNEKELFSYPAVNQTLWRISAIKKLGAYNLEVGIPDSEFMKRAERLSFIQNSCILLSLSSNHRMRVHSKNVSSSYSKKMQDELSKVNFRHAPLADLHLPL